MKCSLSPILLVLFEGWNLRQALEISPLKTASYACIDSG
jgi:hypothetical protein